MDSLSWNKTAVLISVIAIGVESAGERVDKVICGISHVMVELLCLLPHFKIF